MGIQDLKTIVHVNNTGLPSAVLWLGHNVAVIFVPNALAHPDIFPDGILLSGVKDIAQAALNEPTFLLLQHIWFAGQIHSVQHRRFANAYDNTLDRGWRQTYRG